MKLDLVKELMNEFENANVSKMKIEIEGIKLELEKNGVENTTPTLINTSKEVETTTSKTEEKKPTTNPNAVYVKAPLVGVYYSSSSPDKPAFVEVGSKVRKGQTLCIIEAMKVMNEIKAPQDGVITSILASNEDLIEFDQIIMTID
ncbi:MAG: acetyl-CoA carboxylase biotin carboxyl carrier protein subunit [Thomasclavelia sp.]|jgi:acetyl-CoA carboxylase biotin carboxyl carrier protein|nr:acetyl-CoA carboxylase biotin carboxyl carrier protein subunit [Thomasclavelia sp.]